MKPTAIREAARKDRMVTDNSRVRVSVHNETTLRDTKLEDSWKGLRATDRKCLGAAGEAGVEP